MDGGVGAQYPVGVHVEPVSGERNRVTIFFRLILAIPHLLLVGGPLAAGFAWGYDVDGGLTRESGSAGGLLGAVAALAAFLSWFAIVFTGRHPDGLWKLAAFYLRWRVRVIAYTALLRDEYPPFGDGPYPVELELSPPEGPRDRVTVAFRLILAIPHIVVVAVLSLVWALITLIAWAAILFTGRYPPALYGFAVGVMRWNVRVEAYLLLLRDEYPPFSLEEETATF